ncbi:SIR2-like domain-containing protein [Limimonas halophila]|uniref:SIR2-like domain-containing protein n=1 Tax=Limimonas halophila TaxID=1082479 RepID=A0A1G7QJT8_9PROT|nr:SIR2 family protein [Limimonas halophila]SDF98762.1 SIR2-like domain-containing protein [Limimonas halophila]
MSLQIENENSLNAALKSNVNLFLGAGFSKLSEDANNQTLPLGSELKDELITKFGFPEHYGNLNLDQISQILRTKHDEHFMKYLINRHKVKNFSEKYYNLKNISISSIFTTNIDDLIYKVFFDISEYYIHDLSLRGPSLSSGYAVNFVPLHGTVNHVRPSLTFSSEDLASAFSEDPDQWHFLKQKIREMPTIFCGYSLSDASTLKVLSDKFGNIGGNNAKWILVTDLRDEVVDFYRSFGFNIISGDIEDLLDYFSRVNANKVIKQNVSSTSIQFPDEKIPSIEEVQFVRPLHNFFNGAKPVWSDIYSGKIAEISHLDKLIDDIDGNNNSILIGLPASGKTTMLMQAAAYTSNEKHKLMADYMPVEHAHQIVQKLNGEPAIIYLDQLSDSVEAFNFIKNKNNIQVIATEREYNYEIVSHLVDKSGCKLRNITELSDRDRQKVYDSLPEDLKVGNMKDPKMEGDKEPSLFEMVDANIKTQSIKRRYRSVISELNSKYPKLAKLFVMICYVHMTRAPVSFDMILSFVRSEGYGIDDIQGLIEQLGEFVVDYDGPWVDTEQDHFFPRSSWVSEVILDQVPQELLKNVLKQFHYNLSPIRIARFDVFQRRAFDAELYVRAFKSADEGEEFYRFLSEKYDNPFIYQQAALFLAEKRAFRRAFRWIDEAIRRTGGRVRSIRHSHAIILFKANIGADEEEENVRETLDKSMEIIRDCYFYDKRKTYHVVTFAEQALQYFERYGDEKSKEYLRTGKEWLEEESRKKPWHRNVKRLMVKVNGALLRVEG